MTVFLEALRVLALAFFGAADFDFDRGLATRFGDPNDKLDGAHLSCTHQKIQPGQLVCAHRTLPCGTVVVVQNPRNKKLALCEVLDRGPFGAILPSGDWGFKIRRDDPGEWRGIIDLSPAVSEAIDFSGRGRVNIAFVKRPRHLREGRHIPEKRPAGNLAAR